MKYQSLTIENFRGIKKLKIDDLKRVNLLVGRNNCGKTSVLEAVFLLSGMSNSDLPLNIQTRRGLAVLNAQDMLSIFKNLTFENQIILEGKLDNKKRSLKINPLYAGDSSNHLKKQEELISLNLLGGIIGDDKAQRLKKQEELISPRYSYTDSIKSNRIIEGIKLDCYNHKNKLVHKGQINLRRGILNLPTLSLYKESLTCAYMLPDKIMLDIIPKLENLTVEKKLDAIISVLQKLESNVIDLRIGAKGIIYIDIGGNNLLPINIMGDGMRRILAFLTTLAETKNGVVLIDEIENGLHYSSTNIAWNAILTACKAYDIQLIATTHSYEAIEALSNAYTEIEPQGDDIRLYRLDKDGENHKAYSASARELKAGIEKNFEAR